MSPIKASAMLRTTKLMFRLLSLTVLLGCQMCSSTHPSAAEVEAIAPPEVTEFNGTLYAVCKMRPSTTLAEGLPKVYGHVLFKQEYPAGALSVHFHLHGFPGESSQPRAIHIHQYGDFSDGCDSTGGHYNPYRVPHPSHPGDFGNFVADQGKIHQRSTRELAAWERWKEASLLLHWDFNAKTVEEVPTTTAEKQGLREESRK